MSEQGENPGEARPSHEVAAPGHMSAEEFRQQGKRVVDWIADYLAGVESQPVRSQVEPGAVREQLPAHPPEVGEGVESLLNDLDEVILPGITHWQHPSFFAYFPANASGPAILGDLLSSGLGVQGMLWMSSPACTELETLVVDWLAELLGLPEHFRTDTAGGGVIQDSASGASLVAILAATHRASNGKVVREGIAARYTVYASTQAHSSVEKAAGISGIGRDNVRIVDTDADTLAMDADQLAEVIDRDIADGAVPVFVCATIGTTSTTAVDPIPAIGAVCQRYGVWLHVDAAYAGVAAVCPEMRWINAGVGEHVDSYATDPHKWLLTNFDCNVLWVADRAPLVAALSILPEYLRNSATSSGDVVDYRDWQVPLGRRFRGLKLWAVLRYYGAEGLRAHVRRGLRLAEEFAEWVAADSRFEPGPPRWFSLVCFRPLWPVEVTGEHDSVAALEHANTATLRLLERLNDSGALYLTHTKIGGYVLMRVAIGTPSTEHRHVSAAWQRIREDYERLCAEAVEQA